MSPCRTAQPMHRLFNGSAVISLSAIGKVKRIEPLLNVVRAKLVRVESWKSLSEHFKPVAIPHIIASARCLWHQSSNVSMIASIDSDETTTAFFGWAMISW